MGVDIQTYRAKIGTYRRSNGVDVVTVVLVVNFTHGLKAIGSVLFIGLLLVMAGIETNPGPREQDLPSQQSDEILSTSDIPTNEKVPEEVLETLPTPTKIQLSGLPDIMNQKLLEIFFENEEKSGGGKVKEVKVCGTNSAIIEFEETSAVEFIMQNLPLSILGTEVHVKVIETKLTENKPPKTIKVTGLPKGITDDILKLFFESENRQGGGKVVDVTIDRDRNSAIVEFEEATAVDKVMGKRPIKLLGAEVNVEVFVSVENNDNIPPTKLRVKGLLPIMTSEVLTLFFENENQQGGGRVKEVTPDATGNSAVVEFEEAAAVKVVMAKQPISIFGTIVEVEVIDDEIDLKQPKSRTIKVSGLPKNTQEEMIIMFFENERRQGGGKVTNVFINEKDGFALVEFEEDQAVESVLEKQPINFLGCEVKVERYVPPMQILSEIESTKLLVTKLPENVTEDVLVMFFENEKRQGGGNVIEVNIDKEKRCAVVEFEEAKALDKVLQKRPIIIMGTEVNVDVFDGEYPQTAQNTMLVVSGLPRDMSVDFLTMFFENEKRFGGGPVKNVEIKEDTNSAIIDFEEPEAVTIVMKKQPIIIQGTEVHICTFVQEPETEPSKGTQLKVSGLPENISQEYLVMFFENEQRHGGGKVKSVEINEVTRSAIIEFEEEKALATVLQKRPIVIQNKEVVVDTICMEAQAIVGDRDRMSRSPTYLKGFCRSNYTHKEHDTEEPTVMLVSGLPDDVTEEFLFMFFENEKRQGGGNVKTVEINFNRCLAIIEFETPDSLKKVLAKRPILISGKECEVSVFNGSSTVEVRGYTADISSEKHLLKYFENTELSGGEKVQSIRVNKDIGFALVSFLRHEVVKRVCERKHHRLNQSMLLVNTYVPTSTSSECKQIPKTEMIYTRETEQDSSNHLSDENTKTLSEQITSAGKTQEEDASQSKEPDETEGKAFLRVLRQLGLVNKYPGKISMRDVIAIDPNESSEQEKQHISLIDIPWLMLKRLICAHSEARDITVIDEESIENSMDSDNTMSFISEIPEDSQDISPLDIFTVVFQCCDPLMKQVLFQKLYLCKMAVPFLYKHWETIEIHQPLLFVWPLRSLAIENKTFASTSEIQSKEVDVLELPTKVLAFARFGRPKYSKSKLINSLLTSQGCKTYFNIDCPSGMTPRYLSNGQIEMFWLPTIGDKKDRFQEAMTFLNMRGDINEHFSVDLLSFIANFADAVVIIIDLETVLKRGKDVKSVLLKFSSIIFIIANPLGPEVVKTIHNFQSDVLESNPEISLRILSTHKGVVEQNVVDIVSSISKHITRQLQANKIRSYQERLAHAKLDKIVTDEDDRTCQQGKVEAANLIKQMKDDGEPSCWKQVLTPVHSAFSQQLGKLMKERERERDFDEGQTLDRKIKTIRQKQTQSITKTVKLFIDILTRNENSYIILKFFLCWLHFHIEREKRQLLPQLMHDNRCAWEKLKMLKSKESHVPSDIEKQETVITRLEQKIDEASFSVEHFFREIGHINEAMLVLKKNPTKFGLPPIHQIANIMGRLVADGHQLELIDGESFYMPYLWTKTVLQEVDRCISSSKVMTLSVLGLQSSGKSTLLNTMFGSQFSTRSGRCTRGIHVQLIPAKTTSFKGVPSQFDYVLVVDTEGLRSPELSHVQHEHDNELATVITGIGDITMLNIMGENTSEIRDILQVIVHAFLRLKMTNRKLDIRKSCAFIHQNVTDTSASENMISGLSKLMQTLDEMTKESAKSEGILEITTFNHVIEFDINSQVWYLKNLWQGNPPMARVNNEYSERVVDMKCKIMHKALTMKKKSYKSLNDIVEQAHSLWKGVLNEDFVFSFRNSLEIRAYMEMERVVQEQLWHLESFIRDELIKISQTCFANCDQKDNLRFVAEKLIRDLNDVLAEKKSKTEEVIKTYFEKNKYKDIIIQWKHSQHNRIDTLCEKLEVIINEQIEKSRVKRSVEILTVASHKKHEEELRKKSTEVANEYKGQKLNEKQINELFGDIWRSFITKVDATSSNPDKNRKKMKTVFETCLNNIFKNDYSFLKEALVKSEQLTPLSTLKELKGSFHLTGIDDNDISFTFVPKLKEIFGITDTVSHVTIRVNQIFEAIDEKIKLLCQVNDEITEMSVNKLMHELDTSIRAILTGDRQYDFKILFYIKIYVHVSRQTHPVFERHNENYFKTQGSAARLEQYKQQQKISFEAHLSSRQSEDIVAKLFSHVIASFAEEWISQNLPNKITDELYSHLPQVKNRVIVEICTDLLEKGNFQNFIRYLQAPKEYASLWITEKANYHLFGRESRAYASTASALLNRLFRAVETCVRNLQNRYTGKSPIPIETWIGSFQLSLKTSDISIPPENFRNMKKEMKHIQNVEYLTNEILANFVESKDVINAIFSQHGSGSVKWAHSNPVDRIIKKIWGCPEQCAFCGEPCAKNEDHSGSVHYSIQHRPSCCKGIFHVLSKLASLQSCEFDIQSDMTHTCGVFDYVCNKEIRKECGKTHHYRDYETYLPHWDIAPTSNMHDTSRFWMWFVATYKIELHKYYKYGINNIPSSWDQITKMEAKESLHKTYAA